MRVTENAIGEGQLGLSVSLGCILAESETAGAATGRRPGKRKYQRKPGGGGKPIEARTVFEAIVYVLRAGCQWKALPEERFGSASAIHKRTNVSRNICVFDRVDDSTNTGRWPGARGSSAALLAFLGK
jgi:transposase